MTGGFCLFNGKTALVTGATGGIGRAIALEFARQKVSKILLLGRNIRSLAEVRDEVQASGAEGVSIAVDLCDLTDLNVQLARAWRDHGPIDFLVNSAGVAHQAPFLQANRSRVIEEISVNLLGLIETTRIIARRMAKRNEGTIINVSSLMGIVASPTMSTYSATKFGVLGFSRALRAELAFSDVKVVTLLPTLTETNMISDITTMPGVEAVTPEEVAHALIAGLNGNQSEILVGWQAHLALLCKRFAPGLMDYLVQRKASALLLKSPEDSSENAVNR
jgi:3-oxoacyl-[acyl-carrier protein] reductase